jgi:hypothetical protein
MSSMTSPADAGPARALRLRTWGTVAGLAALCGGTAITAGAFLPWVETFAGLIQIPGTRGLNGQILAAAGVAIAVAGAVQVIRGSSRARWAVALAGFGCLAFSAYLLIQLSATVRALGGDPMVVAQGGPGLWVCTAGSLAAFATLFLPSSSRPVLARRDALALARQVRSWAADHQSAGTRRALQVALGLIWIADAALQYQPAMFTPAFAHQVLAPAAMANPHQIAGVVTATAQLVSAHPAPLNTVFATIQLILGIGLLYRGATRAALAGTIAWSLAVWWLGEGLGGLLTGTATPLTGAPGAAVLYALVAVLAWPAREHSRPGPRRHPGPHRPAARAVAAASPLRRWARLPWLVLWASYAYLTFQPATRSPGALHAIISAQASGEPGWLAAADHATAAATAGHGTLIAVVLAGLFLLIGAGIWHPATTRPALLLAAVTAAVIWIMPENLGGILTGLGTDLSTGPLLILLTLAYWPRREPGQADATAAADASPMGRAGLAGQDGRPAARAARAARQPAG